MERKYQLVRSGILSLALMGSLMAFPGCSTMEKSQKDISKTNAEAMADLADRPVIPSTFRVHKSPWLFSKNDRIRIEDDRKRSRVEKVLPGFLLGNVTWTDSNTVTIYDIAKWLTATAGVPVEVHTPRLLKSATTAGTTGGMGGFGGGMNGQVPFPPSAGAGSVIPVTGAGPDEKWNRKLQFHWVDKPLSGLLDMIASGMGLFWDWNGHSIAFYRSATKVYRIVPPPVSAMVNDTISDVGSTGIMGLQQSMGSGLGGGMSGIGGGMSGGGAGGGMPGQNVSVISSSTVWTELQQGLTGIIANKGDFTAMPSAGLVAVTTNPSIMRQVDTFIDKVNSTFNHQIWVEVRVLEVQLQRQDQQDINWNAVIHGIAGAAGGFGFSGSTAAQIFSNGNTSPVTSSTFTLPNSSTTGLVKSLSTRYHTSQVTTVTVRTLNDQSAPIQDVNSQSYLAEILAGETGIGSATFSQSIPGQVTVGFTANILPHLLSDNEHMIIEMSADLSALLSITTSPGTNGGSTIQLPNTASRSFMQRIRIKSGETAIISGYESVNSVAQQTGSLGNPGDFMFGGGSNAQRNRTKIVILITPIVER